MFNKIAVIFLSLIVVGCASNASTTGSVDRSNGLNNFNLVQNESVQVDGKNLDFVVFKKQSQVLNRQVSSNQVSITSSKDFGSGIQWNDDYVVTAKHVNFVENSVYQCGESCDLQFVKRKAVGTVPVWRNHVAGESVVFVGIDKQGDIQRQSGVDMNQKVKTSETSTTLYDLAKSVTVPGMSGGPAYAQDGKVVGMLTGGIIAQKDVSIYLSYDAVKQAWDKFQASQVVANN